MMLAIQTEGEEVTIVPFALFAEANAEDVEMLEQIKTLRDYGQELKFGGGAAPEVVVRFFSAIEG